MKRGESGQLEVSGLGGEILYKCVDKENYLMGKSGYSFISGPIECKSKNA